MRPAASLEHAVATVLPRMRAATGLRLRPAPPSLGDWNSPPLEHDDLDSEGNFPMQAAPPPNNTDFGIMNALHQGGVISWSVFIILACMSVFSFYILFTKLMQQQK